MYNNQSSPYFVETRRLNLLFRGWPGHKGEVRENLETSEGSSHYMVSNLSTTCPLAITKQNWPKSATKIQSLNLE